MLGIAWCTTQVRALFSRNLHSRLQGQDNRERDTAMSELDSKKKSELDSGES